MKWGRLIWDHRFLQMMLALYIPSLWNGLILVFAKKSCSWKLIIIRTTETQLLTVLFAFVPTSQRDFLCNCHNFSTMVAFNRLRHISKGSTQKIKWTPFKVFDKLKLRHKYRQMAAYCPQSFPRWCDIYRTELQIVFPLISKNEIAAKSLTPVVVFISKS